MSRFAVALGGFGGFNSHGAGILDALRRSAIMPDLFSVTSGQIVMLARWLEGRDLRQVIAEHAKPRGPIGAFDTAFNGARGVFRRALAFERMGGWLEFPLTSQAFVEKMASARQYVPTRSDEDLAGIAQVLNDAFVGVVFNTYDYRSGEGILHCNEAARAMLPTYVEAEPITMESVKSALWLCLYGFEGAPQGRLDGAYHRSVILAELHAFETVYVGCPFPTGWGGPAPRTTLDVEDWKTKMWFANSYRAEAERLRRIMDLITRRALQDNDYRIRHMREMSVQEGYGFYDYFGEKVEVFDHARTEALAALREDFQPRPLKSAPDLQAA